MKDKGRRDRGACLGLLHSGDRVLIRHLSERRGTGKLRLYWEDEVRLIVDSKEKENLVYAIRSETNIKGKIRIPHLNFILPCESIFEESEGLHLIQNSSTSSKKEEGGEHERNSQDSDRHYSESDKEERYTPRQL